MRNVLKTMVFVLCLPIAAAAADDKNKNAAPPSATPQPVTVQNTPTVIVGNSPTVTLASMPPVAISSLPAVAISSMPAVTIAGTPTVQLAAGTSVQVSQPAQTPFQISLHLHIDAGGSAAFEGFNVPAGKRFVVEYAAASGGAGGSGQLFLTTQTGATYGTGTGYMSLPLQTGPFGLYGSQLMKAYADPNTQIGCTLYVTAGPADLNCTMNGYFVDVQ